MDNREIDAKVAEAMGWTNVRRDTGDISSDFWRDKDPKSVYERSLIPHFSQRIDDAWEIVEWMRGQLWSARLDIGISSTWVAFDRSPHGDGDHYQAIAPTAPLGICLAFLKAQGVDVD